MSGPCRFTGHLNTEPLPQKEFADAMHASLSGPLAAAVEWTLGRSPRQQPELTILAWLSAFGAIMRGFQTETGLRSNLYVVGVAPSGSGKDAARH